MLERKSHLWHLWMWSPQSTDTKMWYLSDAEAFLAWDWPLGENGFG
jgi:hypothetical protein